MIFEILIIIVGFALFGFLFIYGMKMRRKQEFKKANMHLKKQRLMEMEFERRFYQMLFDKTNTIQYKIKVQRLESDIIELSNEISLF